MSLTNRFSLVAACALALAIFAGCAQTSNTESAGPSELTEGVGEYPPGPAGAVRPRIGVPPFTVQSAEGTGEINMEALAADQLTTLAFRTRRFRVIERAQIDQLLREQQLEGIVRYDEQAQMGQVRGVDLLWIGRITAFRIKTTEQGSGFDLGTIRAPFGTSLGVLSIRNREQTLDVECGVDLRLVDPTSGEIISANSGTIKRTDKAGAFGLSVLGADADASSEFEVQRDNFGTLLRLALDQAVRKMLPDIDYALTSDDYDFLRPEEEPADDGMENEG